MPLYLHSIFAFISCLGFGILFNVKKRSLLLSAAAGAIGWTIVIVLDIPQISYIFANLTAALAVGIFSELCAIIKKTPATVFMVIGIIPLVPGFRIYKSMLFFVNGKLEHGIAEGIHACFMAVAIAVGIILATSLTGLVRRKITQAKTKKQQASGYRK